jgi:hypothetical protein
VAWWEKRYHVKSNANIHHCRCPRDRLMTFLSHCIPRTRYPIFSSPLAQLYLSPPPPAYASNSAVGYITRRRKEVQRERVSTAPSKPQIRRTLAFSPHTPQAITSSPSPSPPSPALPAPRPRPSRRRASPWHSSSTRQ